MINIAKSLLRSGLAQFAKQRNPNPTPLFSPATLPLFAPTPMHYHFCTSSHSHRHSEQTYELVKKALEQRLA